MNIIYIIHVDVVRFAYYQSCRLRCYVGPVDVWRSIFNPYLFFFRFAEIREKHKLELENLTLTKHPFRTLRFFMLAMLQYLKRLATYILSKGALFVVLIVLVLAPGILLAVTDGLHKKVCYFTVI